MKYTKVNIACIFLAMLLLSCNNNIQYEYLVGNWKVSHAKILDENIPPVIAHNGETIALASSYIFSDDSKFVITISENNADNIAQKMEGHWKIKKTHKLMICEINHYALKQNAGEEWKEVKNSKETASIFRPFTYHIEKLTADELIFSDENISYTLRKKHKE